VRYRFKGIVRTTGQTVEGHAHGESPDEALQALSEHGIVTESLREDPEPFAQAAAATNQPFNRAIDSALDVAAAQIPFDAIANRYKGKNVWVLDRDKIRRGVAQVVDQALREALSNNTMMGQAGIDVGDVRKQVSEAITGLFKDSRNLTSNLNNQGGSAALEVQVQRIEAMVHRAESVLAQMTMAIGRIGSGGGWGGGGGPRRFGGQGGPGGQEQNAVLLEIFKDNLRLRGIEIDEPASGGDGASDAAAGGGDNGSGGGGASDAGAPSITLPGPQESAGSSRPASPIRPADPLSGAP
jgi:hypothetical protein